MSYGQKHKKIQILSCDLSYVDVYISEGIVIDEGACLLLPDEFNGYICADTTADGNCLYNAVSYFFIHENSLSTQLRLSTILELMAYADEYLVLEVFEKDYSYSDRAFSKANNKRYQQPEYRNIAPFVAEIMEMCRIGAWSPLGALYGLASVLERPIQSIYSPINSPLLRGFTRIIEPRKQKYDVAIAVLWSVGGVNEKKAKKLLSSNYFAPNHFVGCYLKNKSTVNYPINFDFNFEESTFFEDPNFDSDTSTIVNDESTLFEDQNIDSEMNIKDIINTNYEENILLNNQNSDSKMNIKGITNTNYEENILLDNQNSDSRMNIKDIINTNYEENILLDNQNSDSNVKENVYSEDYNVNSDFNNITLDNTSKLVGLLTHTDVSKIPNSTLKGDLICYEAAKDFTIELPRSQVLRDFVDIILINDETHFKWKQTDESVYEIVSLLKNNKNFPPQIAVAIRKTHKDFYSKMLVLDLYCQGCYGNRDKDRSTFSVKINKQELFLEKEIIHIIVNFNKEKNICQHEQGKSYGQLRGYARKESAIKMISDKLYPRQLRQYALNNISSESRFTGNRQNVPTASAAKTLSAQIKPKKSIIERIHIAIASINETHKSQYIFENGEEAAKKIKMWGYIQPPIKTVPLSIFLLNEASLCYYHMYAGNDPGVFIDYTGSLVRSLPKYLISTHSNTMLSQSEPRILNALMSMNSGSGLDAPIINIFEIITNDLTASNLENYLRTLRSEEKRIYGFNVIPFLINADCGKNILLACLHAYNNESYAEYIKRMLNDLYEKKEHDNSKVIIAWCYGHSIRAVCQYVKDKKFVISCQCKCCDKKLLSKFAMKIWNNVRIQETLYNAEIKARLWHWILEQKTLKLQDLEIDISKISNLVTLNLDYDFNEDAFTEISDLDNLLDKDDSNIISEIYENSLQNSNQNNEFQQFYWKYTFNNETLVLWSNVVTQIRERSRKTTATIEVENKIIKHYDIKQRNLDLDKYLYERTNALKANQLLVADKLINNR
ncbi:vertnin [Rhizophagus irregularis DAOM 181602=DAOM 197198]|nr:vertnin [Rhizophagus irregularis DAOM 181602=DAOM 197198]